MELIRLLNQAVVHSMHRIFAVVKKVAFSFFAVFLLYQSVGLLQMFSIRPPDQVSELEVWIYAYLLSLFITGVFAFPGFVFPTGRVMPEGYYRIHYPKQLSKVFKLLGVQYFRVFLLATVWRSKANQKKFFNGTKQGLKNFIYQTKQSEFGHFGAGVVTLGVAVYLLALGHVYMCVALTVINFIGNGYPVILQRAHRMRIERIVS